MKRKYYKVRYKWKPASAGFPVPIDHEAIGSTVTTGVTIRGAWESFQQKHKHTEVISVKPIKL